MNVIPFKPSEEAGLSRVGLGAWAFGGVGWGPQDDADSIAAIHRAVEVGINWIDTAAVYGDGHAEIVVGDAVARLPESDRPLVFTKGGVKVDRASGTTLRDLSPASLRAQCEGSLHRLGLEQIDLYQIHWPAEGAEAAWELLGELRREGKIRWGGVSNFGVDLLDRCAAIRRVEFVQSPLSLLNRHATSDVLPWAARREAAALVYSPLESGLLTGRFSRERIAELDPDDWRGRRPEFVEPQITRTLDLVARLLPIAAGLGVSLTQLAIAWTLCWPGVAGTIVGARSAAQVDGWVGVTDIRLGPDLLELIATALRDSGAGSGPRRPPGLVAADRR